MSLLKTGDGTARGPRLLAEGGTPATQAGDNRILSRLEHGGAATTVPAARWHPGWRYWAGAGAGATLLLLAALAHEPVSPPVRPVSAPAVATAVAGAPSLPPPAVQQAAAPQAATIVNEAMLTLPTIPPLAVAASPAASAPRKAPAATRQPASRPAATAPGDSDVALLTAMVAHAHRQAGTPTAARDVVLRGEDGGTAGLLQRCKQLGMIEGMLCRSRICSGRWDSDPACH
ncbi:hypothetical protein [Janthinobacterium sp. 1_2014MBL_MicDiv]|uniref:hypothetical protein n=1 Tax=Janthinobacterium sp. 1_2014MBL_MicDiv TaxID=1644131 RepID=UPI0009F69B62|nr:hypothetical protein [Janthinobacterium sp. 1_2014MBL_MicDiv]